MLQRLALYTTLGWLLLALEQTFTTWGFWCVVGLFWAAEHLTRAEVYDSLALELKRLRQQQETHNDPNDQLPK
jgi:hypothetical protein